jgi:hypothetical protein
MFYKKKYLKYKKKYINLKKQSGGIYSDDLLEYVKETSEIVSSDFNKDEIFKNFDLNNLFITNNLETMQKCFKDYKYLEIRKYNNERKLIIGCGNRRLDNRNLDLCIPSECDQIRENIFHSHMDAYTIDMSLVANPSIISEFTTGSKYPTIPDNSFDIIIFEGGGNPADNDDEIKRLLNKNNISVCISQDEDGEYIVYFINKL